MQGERIVRVIYSVQGHIGFTGTARLYDLIITDKRLVGIMKKNLTGAALLGGFGPVGGLAGGRIMADAAKQQREYEVGELDDLVAQEKTSFSMTWDSIEHGKITGTSAKALHLKADGKIHHLQFGKDYIDELEDDLLSKIPTLRR